MTSWWRVVGYDWRVEGCEGLERGGWRGVKD